MSANESRQAIRQLVVKVGASVLTDSSGRASLARLQQIVEQIAASARNGQAVVLVSSGAIACGMDALGAKRRPRELAQLQACAAVGQGLLMHRYSRAFETHGLTVGQVLLTQADLTDRTRCRNARQTLHALLAKRIIPIINENDAVAVEEIAVGDNDRLAALVACLLDADLLVLLTDVDGLLHEGQLVARLEQVDHTHHAIALGSSRDTTTGGMSSKLAAARIAQQRGIPLVIANGTRPGILQDIVAGKPVGTLIAASGARLTFRKWWLAHAARHPKGTIMIDAGAAEALRTRGRSLLASGITEVQGHFSAGELVSLVDDQRRPLGRGLCAFSSSELQRIRGLKSQDASKTLGRRAPEEVVHRDQLVLTQELA